MNKLFIAVFVAVFAATNGMFVEPKQQGLNSIDAELDGQPLCEPCKIVVEGAVYLMKNGETELEVEHLVKRVCEVLPGALRSVCENVVDQYGKQIIEMIADSVDPENICSLLMLCGDQLETVEEIVLKEPDISSNVGSIECWACKLLVNEIKKLANNSKGRAIVEKAIHKACCVLPSKAKKECDHLIDKYADKIIDLVINSFSTETICSVIQIC
nr:prosaposin-like [Leptinotarsa decemlineata]